jgi:NitT/TauT family transport system substrate-binding protein
LTIGYVPSTLFAPVFVAAERGYLHDAGFAPTLTPIVAGQDAMALVSQSQLDVAAGALSAGFFNGVQRGLEVKYVASTAYQPAKGHPSALEVRQDLWDGGLRTLRALRGKKIGWNGGAGAASAYYVARILRGAGMRLSDIEGVNVAVPDQEVALQRKAIDAIFASAPYTELFVQRHEAAIVASPPAGIAASGIFIGPTLLHDANRAKALLGALRRAVGDLAGAGWYSPASLEASAKYTQQPPEQIAHAPRYDVRTGLPVDRETLLDMQHEFLSDNILGYTTPLPESHLVATF